MCGDNRQLPPIGAGNIFSDLLNGSRDEIALSSLTRVLRQAEKSGILKDANMIRDGKYPIAQPELKITTGELNDMTYMFRDDREQLHRMAINTFMKAKEIDGLDEVVIVTPRRDNCMNSATEFNLHITQLLFDEWDKHVSVGKRHYFVGSKVMQIVNDAERGVFNGEIGYVTAITEDGVGKDKMTTITVEFKMNDETKTIDYDKSEMDQLDLAYAMTCHKLQGSGIKSVIIVLDMTHYTLLDTCMLYTAITRAKKRCLLLSEPNAFKMCMKNNKGKSRKTWLSGMK
jgi:exodeoxyribonuclease V alpha subunit